MLYDIPVGRGKRFSTGNKGLDYILGNWQVNKSSTPALVAPYNVFYGGADINGTGNVTWAENERANLVGDPSSGSCPNGDKAGTPLCAFNTNAFAVPALGVYGNSGRDAFRAAPYWNLDMSIFRQFPFWGEGRRIEFRAEAFNLFNTTILGSPESNTGTKGNDISSPSTFGTVNNAANTARQLQFALKIIF